MGAVRFPISGVTYHTVAERKAYCESGAWIWTTLGEMLREAAREMPDRAYIIAEDGALTFAQTDNASESLAACLLELGLKPGDRAIFQMGTVKEIVIALYGCIKAGVIPVCTLPQYRDIEIGQLTELSQAKAYFVQADFSSTFDQAAFARRMVAEHKTLERLIVARGEPRSGEYSLEELGTRYAAAAARARTQAVDPLPGDVAMFQLSGGSTGVPKIIPRMHAEYLGTALAWATRHGLRSDDISLWALPLIHNAGMIVMLVPSMIQKRTLVIRSRFDVDDFLGAIERYKVTYTGSIGPIAPRIIEHPNIGRFDLSSLRMMFTLARADGLEEKIGVACQQMYGITEGMLLGSLPNDAPQARHHTMGWPTGIGDEVRLLKPGTDEDVQPGETGEFCFRGPHVLRGYCLASAATTECFTSDGFFRSGDLMRAIPINGRSYYFFEGRLKDNINRGGEKFGAEEVERLIVRHPAVNDARIVAMPDPFLGERACAFIIVRPDHECPTVESLGGFLQQQGLAKFKLPERIEIIADFPVTRVGKVDKQALRKIIADKLARPGQRV